VDLYFHFPLRLYGVTLNQAHRQPFHRRFPALSSPNNIAVTHYGPEIAIPEQRFRNCVARNTAVPREVNGYSVKNRETKKSYFLLNFNLA
jgi:hypothetical protein